MNSAAADRQSGRSSAATGVFPLSTFLFPLLLLPGCTVGPDYVRPEPETPAAWRYEISETSDIANTAWWAQFDDPTLDGLVRTALVNNRDVRIAAARVEEFAARVDIARAGAWPQFGYGGSVARDRISLQTGATLPAGVSRSNDSYAVGLNVGWELDVWGKIRRATEAARAQLLAEEETRRSVILTLVSATATAYVNLRALDAQLVIARETLTSRAESLKLFEDQFAGGVISELELAQVRSEYEQAAVAIPAIERQIALQENALSVLLGANPGPIPRGRTLDELAAPPIPAGIPSDVLLRRPDLRAAEQDLVAANANIGVARAQYFPSISLTGLFGYASAALGDLLSSPANLWNATGALTGPIFAGGVLSGQLRVTEAVQRQALEGYLRAVQTAFREVDDALISTVKHREELVAQARRIKALENYAHHANSRYNEGYVSYIEVLDAERRLFDAQLTYVQNQNLEFAALISVYKAMGGGWVELAEESADAVDFSASRQQADSPSLPDKTLPTPILHELEEAQEQ